MEAAAVAILRGFDIVRSRSLRWTMSWDWARRMYCDRATRLLMLFLVAAGANLFLAMAFPLWVLIVGPAVWGVPHLFATARYTPVVAGHSPRNQEKNRRIVTKLAAVFIVAAVCRLILYRNQPGFAAAIPNAPELVFVFPVLAILGLSLKPRSAPALLLSPLFGFSFYAPLTTAAVLAFAHNFMAFPAWYRVARTSREKTTVMFSFVVCASVTGLLFAGAFDDVLTALQPSFTLFGGHIDLMEIARETFPNLRGDMLLSHGIIAFAFGQATHYFVWLKAIPDQNLETEIPATFRQSFRLLKRDFGLKLTWIAAGCVAVMAAVWILAEVSFARTIYLSAASFHGYAELAALALAVSPFKRSP